MKTTLPSNSTPAVSTSRTEDDRLLAATEITNAARIWQTVLEACAVGDIDEAANQFADQFTFIDYALGLEFKQKDRLREFLVKIEECFPGLRRTDHTLFNDGDSIVSEWTISHTQDEPFLYGYFLRAKTTAQGVSVVRVRDGRIVKWSEYYDQVTSRRYRLAAWFTNWSEV